MAEPLTIALLLEATDNASEFIDRVKTNLDSLVEQANATADSVSGTADAMTDSLSGMADASDAVAAQMQTVADTSDEASVSLEAQTAATRELFVATQELEASTDEMILATTKMLAQNDALIASTEETTAALDEETAANTRSSVSMKSLEKSANVLGLAFVAAAAVAIKMALDFQESTASLQGHADITANAANKVANAFLNVGGQTEFTANQMMSAFAPVSGAFENMYGHALDAAQSLKFMDASMMLAEASGGDLTSTTAALTSAMMVYHLKVSQAAGASNDLFNTARLLGVSVDDLGSSFSKLEPMIAGSNMSLAQTGGFMDELGRSAGSGMMAMRTAGKAIAAIVSPSSTARTELAELGITLENAKGKFIGMGPAIEKIHDALAKLPATAHDVADAQKMYALQQEEATLGTRPQTEAIKTQESALSTQISALNLSTEALSKSTVMTDLFGASAGEMTGIVSAGAAGLNRAAEAVARQGAAAKAAAEQQKTFEGMLKKLESAAEALFIKLGQHLIPIMTKVVGGVIDIVNAIVKWTSHNKGLTEIIIGVVVGLVALVKVIQLVVWATKLWEAAQVALDVVMDAGPQILLVAAILALIAVVILCIKYWHDLEEAFVGAWDMIKRAWDDAVGFFKKVFDDVVDTVKAHWKEIVAILMMTPLGPIVLLITAVVELVKHFKDVEDAVRDSWDFIRDVWSKVAGWFTQNVTKPVIGFFEAMWNAIPAAASAAWGAIQGVWNAVASWFDNDVIQPIVGFFSDLWDDLSAGAKAVFGAIKDFAELEWNGIKDIWGALVGFFTPLFDDVETVFKVAFGAIRDFAEIEWDGIKDIWEGAVAFFSTVFGGVETVVKTIFGAIGDFIKLEWNGIKDIWDGVAEFFEALWRGVQSVTVTVWDGIRDVIGGVWDGLVATAKTIWGGVERAAVDAWDAIVTAAQDAWNGVSSVWGVVAGWFDSTVISPVSNFFTRLWDDVIEGAKKVVHGIEDAFKGVGSLVNKASGGLLGDVGGLGKIIGLAEGGLVNSPTLAVVGEAGPEMVIPLSTLPGGTGVISGGNVSPLPLSSAQVSASATAPIVVNIEMAGQVYGSLNQLANALGRQLATVTVPGAGTRLTAR